MKNETFKRDDLTREIVQKAGIEQPSYSFTSNIMEQLRRKNSVAEVFIYRPIINRKTWMLLIFAITVVLTIFTIQPVSEPASANDFTKYLTPAQNAMDAAATGFFQKLSFLKSLSWTAAALIAGWLLLAMDKLLRTVKIAE